MSDLEVLDELDDAEYEVEEEPGLTLAQRAKQRKAEREQSVMSDMVLTESQRLFARSRFRFPAFVGGFGSGKTAAAMMRTLALVTQSPGCDVAYYLPTHPLIADIAFARFPDLLERFGVRFKLNKTAGLAHIHLPDYNSDIKFRSMDRPEGIVGYEVAHSILDELDTLPTAKANQVWVKVLARNRQKCPTGNTIGVATTPEGFRFVWQRWVRDVKGLVSDYRIYRASTWENAPNLPVGYIESLMNSYPANLLAAYLDGEFVNLTSGSVYGEFNRVKNFTNDTVQPGDALHVGMDFNVGKMAAVIHVLREGKPRAVAERVGVFDTPAMVALLKRDFSGHPILVYPDASGQGRKTNNASESDLSLLRQAQFRVCVNGVNPAVRDRVLAMNKQFEDASYKVNPDTCPSYTESLEKQSYNKNGEPDKSGDMDHAPDAGGYFIAFKFPIVKRSAVITNLKM